MGCGVPVVPFTGVVVVVVAVEVGDVMLAVATVVELPITMVPFAGVAVDGWFVPAAVVVVFTGTVVFDAVVPLIGTKVS